MAADPSTTRDALLDAAEQLFGQHGYAAVGVREIVERAGANIAAIKYHFGSKNALYVEVVRRSMQRRRTDQAWAALVEPPATTRQAARSFIRFIRLFLDRLMDEGDSSAAICLMLREASEPSEAIDAIVNSFVMPHQERLIQTLSVLCPDARRETLALAAQSVIGQILHYRVFRPFLERIPDHGRWTPRRAERVAAHIARFSLLGLGCRPEQIRRWLPQPDRRRRPATSARRTVTETVP